jgi:hypothetical protein
LPKASGVAGKRVVLVDEAIAIVVDLIAVRVIPWRAGNATVNLNA